ncbi:MAG: imelysin family protein [Cyclobacteriaceae bacterium]
MKRLTLISFAIGAGLLISCNEGALDKTNDFDQRPLLENLGNNLILPAYEHLTEANEALSDAFALLKAAPNATTLEDFRSQLKNVRLAWQACAPYQFGPAETRRLTNELNIYPIDQTQINQNISSGDYDLSTLSNFDAKGFQAISYLVYGDPESQQDILSSLTEGRLQYIEDLLTRISSTSLDVYNDWKEDYLSEFVAEDALGVDVGSSIGKLINALNRDFERNTRDGKIGIPVGIRTLGEPIPKSSEAYYAGYSVELLEANIQAYETLYFGGNGIGLDDYLEAVGGTTIDNADLNQSIISQFEKIESAIGKISDPLPQSIENQKADVEMVFIEMQIMNALLKTDLSSTLGVVITYQDNDGD